MEQFNFEELDKELISRGGQAEVYIMEAPRLFCQAVGKIFFNDAYDEISGELELLMRVRYFRLHFRLFQTQSHPHMVHIYGYILRTNQHVGIMMEYCSGGTVADGTVIHYNIYSL